MPFRLPVRVSLRPGALADLDGALSPHGSVHHLLLVTDTGLESTPWPSRVRAQLEAMGVRVTTNCSIEANPRSTTVDALALEAREVGISGVIGLGGGSVLDAAKAIAMLLHNPGGCADYEGRNRFAHSPAPFIAIPTTCGTGSEVTWVSVITHPSARRKMSIKGDGMFPTAALVDSNLLTTLPSHLVAYTGLDALTHALEAYTGTEANPASDALAEKAITLLFQFLPRAVQDIAGDAEARSAVMEASTLAGMAFGNADVAGVHCLSETLGGLYDIPHGLGNALLLEPVFRYHLKARAVQQPLARLYQRLAPPTSFRTHSVDDDAERFMERLAGLIGGLNLPGYDALSIVADDVEQIASLSAQNNSNRSNPQTMAASDYRVIIDGILQS